MPLAAFVVAALIVAAVALGGGTSKKAEPVPKGPGGTPGNGGTPPPGVYDDCLDAGMPPALAAQVTELLTKAKEFAAQFGTSNPAAKGQLAALLQQAGDQAALQGYPKAAACLKQQAAALGAGGAGGGVFTIAQQLPERGAPTGPRPGVFKTSVQLLGGGAQKAKPQGGAPSPGDYLIDPTTIPSCANNFALALTTGVEHTGVIPEPYATVIRTGLQKMAAGQLTADQISAFKTALQQQGFLNAQGCLEDLADALFQLQQQKAQQDQNLAAFQKAGF